MSKNIPAKPVYEEDQVITQADLAYLIKTYKGLEELYAQMGNAGYAQNACAAHSVCEALDEWIRQGKQRTMESTDEDIH